MNMLYEVISVGNIKYHARRVLLFARVLVRKRLHYLIVERCWQGLLLLGEGGGFIRGSFYKKSC